MKTFQILCLTGHHFCRFFQAFACRGCLHSLVYLLFVSQPDQPRWEVVMSPQMQHSLRVFLMLDLRLLFLHHWCQGRRSLADTRPAIKNEIAEK